MGTLWVYIVRAMKKGGYSIGAIEETLANLNIYRSRRSIYDALCGVTYRDSELPYGYVEWFPLHYQTPPKYQSSLNVEKLKDLLRELECGEMPDFATNSRGTFSDECQNEIDGFAEVAALDSDSPPDAFSFWAGDSYKSGLKRYLDYERRSNESESRIDRNGFKSCGEDSEEKEVR